MSNPISPLRQRMIDDMTFRNMSPSTHKVYTYAVANFSAFHRRSPDKLGIEDVREYRLHLIARGLKANSINPIVGALRFFYGTTLGRKDIADQLPFARQEDTLPAVLTQDEVLRLLKAESNLKMRTAYTAIYAAGLRVSEVVALTIKDIDSTRKVIHIRQAKGRKDRYVDVVRAIAHHPSRLLAPDSPAALVVPRP
jgi:integrase/recombinase XerD